MNNTFDKQAAGYGTKFKSMNLPKQSSQANVSRKPSAEELQLMNTAKQCWDNYKSTPAGAAKLEAMKNMSIPEIQKAISEIYKSKSFMSFHSEAASASSLSFKSFSLGVGGSLSIVIGVTVTVGCVFDLSDPTKFEGYVTAGAMVGADVELDFVEDMGLWVCEYNNFGGVSYGGIISGAEVGGIAIGAYFSSLSFSDSFLGFSFGFAEGEGVEVAFTTSYTWLVDPIDSFRPVVQKPKGHFLILTKLECEQTSDDGIGDEDEVYFTFQADNDVIYYFPKTNYFSMKDSGEFSTWNCGRSVYFDQNVTIQVYDQDDGSGDDPIGNITLTIHDLNVNLTEKGFQLKKDNGASYKIYAKLVY